MEGVQIAGRDCPGIRYLRGLSQRIQSIGYAPWTRYPKPSVPSHLVHLPQTPVHQSGPVVDLGLKEYVSETIDVDCEPKVEFSTSLISLPSNPDHESSSTVGLGPEQTTLRCSETANMEEILTSLRRYGILRRDPDPQVRAQVLPKPVHRPACAVPPGFEPLTSTSTHRYLRCLYPRPAHPSACTVPQGYEPLSSTPTGIVHLDTASKLEFDIGLTSLPPRQVHVSGSSIAPGFEQDLSIGSDTTDSDGVSEPEIIRDTTRLARTAVLASGAEVQQSLDQLLFTRFNKVLNNSESSDSDGIWDFVRADGSSDLVHVKVRTAALASGKEVPSDLEQSSISFSYSASNSDSTDSDVLSDLEKRSFKYEVKERATGPANSSTGARADVLVAEEPKTRRTDCQDSGAAVHRDKRSFNFEVKDSASGPANSSTGARADVLVTEEQKTRRTDCKDSGAAVHPDKRSFNFEVKESASGPANSWTGARAGVLVAEEPKTRRTDCKDPGAVLYPNKRSFKYEVKESANCGRANSWTGARAGVLVVGEPKTRTDCKDPGAALYPNKRSFKYEVKKRASGPANSWTGAREGVLVAGEPKTGRTDCKDPGAALYPNKRSFKYVVKESGSGSANSSTGARAGVLVAEEPKTRGPDCKDSGAALRASTSEGVASRFKLNPNAKEFVPRALKSGNVLAPNAKEFVPRAFKSGNLLAECGLASPRLQKVQLFGVELTRSSAEAKAHAQVISAPGHLPLDLGTALRMNHERKGWVKWSQTKEFISGSNAEVVWGSGRGKASTGKSGPVQDLKLPSGSKSTTPAREFNGNRRPTGQTYRPSYSAKPYRAR